MEAVEILMKEHRLIERVLDAMEAWIKTVGHGNWADDKEELAGFVTFIREFTDAYHHRKEEDVLFVAMVDHGFPRKQGPVAVLLHEHDLGRSLASTLHGLARQLSPWSEEDRRTLTSTTREYVSLLRRHIQKEDKVLYPMADARLPDPIKEEIFRRFKRFEEERTRNGEPGRLHRLADTLIDAADARTS